MCPVLVHGTVKKNTKNMQLELYIIGEDMIIILTSLQKRT